ncbi:hypothetical protein ml_19 [Mollivirus sibericum]|uniref:hypothetical protein n=1 Tax=Mollivirus sibericum TaxID=1678078 RepID=UPI0006B2E239|nr:hypothetical protein ml_19 [Mollivirus sibericum]ALD61821.1 hypothetical protein ml_19 [Mollivirus sibericum]
MTYRISAEQRQSLVEVMGPNRLCPEASDAFFGVLESWCNDTHWSSTTCEQVLSLIRDGMGFMLQRLFRDQYGQHPEFERVVRGQTYHRQPSLDEINELSRRMKVAVYEQGRDARSIIDEWKRENPHYNLTLVPREDLATREHNTQPDGTILFPRHL